MISEITVMAREMSQATFECMQIRMHAAHGDTVVIFDLHSFYLVKILPLDV